MFKKIIRFVAACFAFIFLTVLTQTGGLILLLFWLIRYLLPKSKSSASRFIRNWSLFLVLYIGINFLIVPHIAAAYGKVPMPVFHEQLQPHRWAYAFFNRHYVTPQMRKTMLEAAEEMNKKYSGTVIYYLDGSHPIGYPRLYPHLKHKSGRKLDVCFFYKDKNTGHKTRNPAFLGYGYFVKPQKGETNLPARCAAQGSWWYGFTGYFVLSSTGKDVEIDATKNAYFMRLLTKRQEVRRAFIEPHLKERFGLQKDKKIGFHGCWAVRHDDHAHIEVR